MEKFCLGKQKNQDLCEDGLFISEHLIVVIDGVTAKGNLRWQGKTSGCYAKDVLLTFLNECDCFASAADFFYQLSFCLKRARYLHPDCLKADFPRAGVIAYDFAKRQIWSYGDCNFLINGQLYTHEKIIDVINSQRRAELIEEAIAADGEQIVLERLAMADFARAGIAEALLKQQAYENCHYVVDGVDYGYPVLNGEDICLDMLKVYDVQSHDEIVLASDGYPLLKNSLKESEAELTAIMQADPFCFRLYKSTKGLQKDALSFDDRTYIRFRAL